MQKKMRTVAAADYRNPPCDMDHDGDPDKEDVVAAHEGSGALVFDKNYALFQRIACRPSPLDFGKVPIGHSVHTGLEIANSGGGILKIETLEILGSGVVEIRIDDPGPFRPDPGERMIREISCT